MAHDKSRLVVNVLVGPRTSSVPSTSKLLIKWDKTVTKVVHMCNILVVTVDLCIYKLVLVKWDMLTPMYTVSQKKTRHQTLAHNFPKC